MKLAATIAALSAAAPRAAALGRFFDNPSQVMDMDPRDLYEEQSAPDGVGTIVFDECLGKPLRTCRGVVMRAVRGNPNLFGFHPKDLHFEGIPVRSETDEGYNKVFIKTDFETSTKAVGVMGDGMIFYPFEWHKADGTIVDIGPWDCSPGDDFLSWQTCCTIVQGGAGLDISGNPLGCEPSHPVGSPANPREPGRVIIHVNEENKVVHPPRVE